MVWTSLNFTFFVVDLIQNLDTEASIEAIEEEHLEEYFEAANSPKQPDLDPELFLVC